MTSPTDTTPFFAQVIQRDGQLLLRDVLEPRRELTVATSTTTSPVGSYVIAEMRGQDAASERRSLAAPETALHELYALFAENHLSPCFPAVVEEEASTWVANPPLSNPDLVDLEALPFVTIDGEHSKDLDQALFLERQGDAIVVFYALADASHYVRPGTALFEEAMVRGSSYYLPGVMVPMLPKLLSEGLISLNAEVPRRAVVFEIHVGPDGNATKTTIKRARIRSRAKLNFAQVQAYYDKPTGSPLSSRDFSASLACLPEFAARRRCLSQEHNVVRYKRTEIDAHLPNHATRRFVVTRALRHPVETYNEQLSLLCNTEGARILEAAKAVPLVEPIYRVHPQPDVQAFEEFRHLTERVTALHQLSSQWTWHREQTLADYLANLPEDPKSISDAIQRQAVMLNVGSSFQAQPGNHFGVGSEVYARFSAPMREIVGVFLHRELLQALGMEPTDDEALRDRVVERANYARQLQKRITNASNLLILDQIFGEQLGAKTGTHLEATIVGLAPKKIHVTLAEPPVDAKVLLADVRADWQTELRVSEDLCAVVSGDQLLWRLGDRVRLLVLGHDVARQHWRLSIAR